MADQDIHGNQLPTEKGIAPKERMPNANQRRERCQKLIEEDRKRARFDARIRGCRDGNPPYDSTKLRAQAQGWRDNTNYMGMYAAQQAALVPYFDLFSGASHLCNIQLRLEDPTVSQEKSFIAVEEWDRMLKEADCFENNVMLTMGDRVLYGKGFMAWDDPWSMLPTWVNRFNVHVPPATKANVMSLEELVVEEEIQVCKLWAQINMPRASDVGWNVAECKRAIRRAQPRTKDDQYRPDQSQQRVSDHDDAASESLAMVRAAHHYVKEYNGKISHYIVELDTTGTSMGEENKPDGDLFAKPDEAESWKHLFWASFQDTSDASWNGASGLGKVIIKPIEIQNRVKCAATDLTFQRACINIQPREASGYGKVATINQGAFTVWPPGYEMMNVASFVGDIESVMVTDEALYRNIGRTTGIYHQLPEKTPGNPLTATGELLRQQQSAILTNAAVSRFYRDLDRLYTEMYRRAVNAPAQMRDEPTQSFIERCSERGVTLADLKKVDYIRAQRVSGNGSQIMRQQNLAQLAPLVAYFPPKGQESWVRDSAATLTNFDTASRYIPMNEVDEVTHHHQIAQLENDSLVHGSPVVFSPNDNHVIHAQSHLQNATGAIQSIEQGADPATVLAALDMLMPHANAHILYLEGNPARQNEAKALRDQWNQFNKIADDIRKNVEKIAQRRQQEAMAQARAQAIQQGQDPEMALKAAEQEFDLRLRAAKTQELLRQKGEKDKAGMAMADAKTASDIRLATARTAADIQQSTAKHLADLEAQRVKTAQAAQPKTEKPAENPTINIAVKSDVPPEKPKQKRAKKVTFERDKKGKLVGAKIEQE